MGSFKALLLTGVASLAAMTSASAADLFLPPPPPLEPTYVPVEFSGGFYLRGDVGIGFDHIRGTSSAFDNSNHNLNACGGVPCGFAQNGSGVDDQAIIGVGVGYQFNSYFRADITGEYRAETNYNNLESYSNNFNNATCGSSCYDTYHAKLTSGVILANGYVDLGTWYGITPFVGAGAGVALNKVGNLTDVTSPYNGGAGATVYDNTKANFAWALTAGVSYAVAPHMKLELSYRYLDAGSFQSSPIYCNSSPCNTETQRFKMTSSDVRLGLRYMFADFVPLPPPPPPPLVRKY